MKVWVVTGDDHDYDAMSNWCVGVFSSEDKAREAVTADRKRYKGHMKPSQVNYEILPFDIDQR